MKFQNCIHCAVGRIIPLGSIVGLPFIKYSCRHTNELSQITLYRSQLCLCISLSILFMIMVMCGLCAKKLINAFQKDNAFYMAMIYTSDLMFLICSMLLMVISMLGIKNIIAAINTAQDIVTELQNQTSTILLTKIDTFKLRIRIAINLALIGIILCIAIVTLFYIDSDPHWSFTEKIGTIVSCYVNLMMGLMFDTLGHLYISMFINYQTHLQNDLIEVLYVYSNLSNSLTSYGQLHIKLKKLIMLFNSFLNPTILMWLVASILLLICSTSLIVMCLLESKSNPVTVRAMVIIIELGAIFFAMIYLSLMTTRMKSLVRDSLKFLYQYPISSLTNEEALKLEIIKSFFIKLQPVIVASEIVPIDVTLIGSISGTVLTYVVVAIQFQILIWRLK